MEDKGLEKKAKEVVLIKNAIVKYGNNFSDFGASVAASLLYSGQKFNLNDDLDDYLELKSHFQAYGSGESEAGANIAAALLWNSSH